LGGSRKYLYPYHGRHLGIPKGAGGGYVDWNSEDMGGYVDWYSEDMGRVHWTGIPKAYGILKNVNVSV